MADKYGWTKGVGPYSKSYPQVSRGTDYTARGIAAHSFGDGETNKGFSGSVKQGSSPPRFRAKANAGTSPKIRAASPSGKYHKTGGRGKGFGA